MTRGHAGTAHLTPPPADPGSDPLVVRAVLRLYPRPWRDRYGEEFASLLCDMTAAAPWPSRARIIADAASGALDAHAAVLGKKGMPGIRTPLAAAACAVVAFAVARVSFTKMNEGRVLTAAAHVHTAVTALAVLRTATILAAIAVLAGALPLGWSVLRQAVRNRRPELIRPLAIPLAAAASWLAAAKGSSTVLPHWQAHPAIRIAAIAVIVLLGAAAAASFAWGAVAIVHQADLAPRLLRFQVGPMTGLSVCMATATGAFISWGLALRAADPALLHGDHGLLATPLAVSWAGAAITLIAITTVTAVATIRAARVLRSPAT